MPSLGIGHRAGCTMSKSRTHGSRWRRRQMCCRRVCASTPGYWGSNNPVLALSFRRCRTATYTSSVTPRFPTMRLSPRPFGSRSGGRLGVICPELRPPLVAIPSVRDTAHTFASYGSRERDLYGHVHFARSPPRSWWTACAFPGYLCTVFLPSPSGPSPCTRLSRVRTTMPHLTAWRASEVLDRVSPTYFHPPSHPLQALPCSQQRTQTRWCRWRVIECPIRALRLPSPMQGTSG